jgi:redox-sensing transcriptional repressor
LWDRLLTERAPDIAVRRLSIYCRCLEEAEEAGRASLSSEELAEMAGVKSAQIRRDLAYFGHFGVRGRGYDVADLKGRLRAILGTDRTWPVVIVGAGSLGTALASYRGFGRHGVRFAALLDVDPAKVGGRRGDVPVLPMDRLGEIARREGVRIAILAVPAAEAQRAAEALAAAGVEAILNFAPVRLDLPAGVRVQNVDLSISLEALTHALADSAGGARRARR